MKNISIALAFCSLFIFTAPSLSSDKEYTNLESIFANLSLQTEAEKYDVDMSDLSSFDYKAPLSDIDMEESEEIICNEERYLEILKRITILKKWHSILIKKEEIQSNKLSMNASIEKCFFQEIKNTSDMIKNLSLQDVRTNDIKEKISGSSLKDFFKV